MFAQSFLPLVTQAGRQEHSPRGPLGQSGLVGMMSGEWLEMECPSVMGHGEGNLVAKAQSN